MAKVLEERCDKCGAVLDRTQVAVVTREVLDDIVRSKAVKVAPVRSKSPINRDPEVRDFLLQNSGGVTIKRLVAMAVDRFGEIRAPSLSATHRFLQRAHSSQSGQFPNVTS